MNGTGTDAALIVREGGPGSWRPDREEGEAKRILALAGSLRRGSFNRLLLFAAAECAPQGVSVRIYEDLASIPLFDEDLERESGGAPAPVRRLREELASADGLLIATPEYNHSVPGVLKNAIDWLSRPAPDLLLRGKPAAVIGATPGPGATILAQSHLRHVLSATGALVLPPPGLVLADAAVLFDRSGGLAREPTRELLAQVMASFAEWIDRLSPRRLAAAG